MSSKINIRKLDRGAHILLETEETVFEIVIKAPSTGSVTIHGGTKFVYKTKATMVGNVISGGQPVSFVYKNSNSTELKFKTSKVVSAKVYGPNKKWHYDAIEKKDKR